MPEATEERLIDVLQFISKERNIPFEMLIEALEAALLTAYKRHFGSEANAIVTVDRQTGEYKVFHRRTVVDEVADPKLEVTPKEAGKQYQVGDYFDEEVTPKDFGRIAAFCGAFGERTSSWRRAKANSRSRSRPSRKPISNTTSAPT